MISYRPPLIPHISRFVAHSYYILINESTIRRSKNSKWVSQRSKSNWAVYLFQFNSEFMKYRKAWPRYLTISSSSDHHFITAMADQNCYNLCNFETGWSTDHWGGTSLQLKFIKLWVCKHLVSTSVDIYKDLIPAIHEFSAWYNIPLNSLFKWINAYANGEDFATPMALWGATGIVAIRRTVAIGRQNSESEAEYQDRLMHVLNKEQLAAASHRSWFYVFEYLYFINDVCHL